MKERAPFLPITVDVDDDALERLAQKKGVAEMVKPGAGEGLRSPAKDIAPAPEVKMSKAPPRTPFKSLSVEVPEYVWKEMKLRAVHRGTSLRHVILTALVAEGFDIKDADMFEDGRRQRGGHDAG